MTLELLGQSISETAVIVECFWYEVVGTDPEWSKEGQPANWDHWHPRLTDDGVWRLARLVSRRAAVVCVCVFLFRSDGSRIHYGKSASWQMRCGAFLNSIVVEHFMWYSLMARKMFSRMTLGTWQGVVKLAQMLASKIPQMASKFHQSGQVSVCWTNKSETWRPCNFTGLKGPAANFLLQDITAHP